MDLTRRQTSLRNYLNRMLAHETWRDRRGLWSQRGQGRLRRWARGLRRWDRMVVTQKLDELEEVEQRRMQVKARLERMARRWPAARRLDAIDGLGALSAVGIAACLGPVRRFVDAEAIISYAGLAPGVRQSDSTRRDGHVGGGGTDKLLRHYLIEATLWARRIPRFAGAYRRMLKRRGKKVARLHLARLLVRSIDAVLRYDQAFDPAAPDPRPGLSQSRPLPSPAGGGPPEGPGAGTQHRGPQVQHHRNALGRACPGQAAKARRRALAPAER
ncbi:MAG: transposase [Phycisphaeraceae bacterium]